ncbi:MAG: VIT domain-containing protein [Methanothrix soehngenii]|jgi:Ca-activated chloride channel family protein|uniref:VIT domain-containing protein n=1 Tax=Methanothrix soehngenii TaxID=2223 RepID=UPI0023F2F919|nr:VIT domain-containing protein [Methanothrix soehngenii]MDD4488786.1 VIT domain-containing protein [Methanothrix soehngenii]MDD5256880.1 VIT domain-containing protein [Methanothrix soehngenii]
MWKYILLMLFAVSVGLMSPAGADGIIIVDPPPGVDVRLDQSLAIKYHHVDIQIKDQVATTRVDQVFVNDNPWTAEGTYIFPLPQGAAVSDFVMWVDGKAVHGEILEADEARTIYDDVVRRMKDPALLEYVGRKALKASVFPIPPGEERKIELEYSQILPVENGLVHYIYPLSTERFSSRPLEDLVVRAQIESREPLKAVYSSRHEVSIDREDDYHALLGLEQSDVLPDRDFELFYTISSEKIGLNLLSFKEEGQDGFFLLLAAPDVKVNEEEIVVKDIILVLDTSGSMQGEKMDQAKEAARYVLDHLNPLDRFAIVSFATTTRSFSPSLEPAAQADKGKDFLDRLEAMGSTDINRAMIEAVGLAEEVRPTTLIFLTDGLPTEGVTVTGAILDNVARESPDNVRIFSFGVGDDVDTDLLDQISLDHGGASTYVRPGEEIDEEVSAFYRKVKIPVLSDLSLDWGDIIVDQVYPQRIPDLFAGSQLILLGRYREGGPAKITLKGMVNQEERSYTYEDLSFRKEGGDDFIPRLWATRAVGYYLTQIRLYGEKQEWIDSIVSLSTRYGIITPYTSFLVQEKDIFSDKGREEVISDFEEEMAAAAAEPAFGEAAVEKAVYQKSLSAAPVGAAVPVNMSVSTGIDGTSKMVRVSEVLKNVGSKTFLLKNDTWIDTTFDRSMKTKKVAFLGEEYFDLISQVPVLGSYFALGERVIVVHEGQAYETVAEDGSGSG